MRRELDLSFHPGSWALPLWLGYAHYTYSDGFQDWSLNLGFLCFSLDMWIGKPA